MKTSLFATGLILISLGANAAQTDCRVFVKGLSDLMDHDSSLESSVGMVLMKKNVELIERRDVQENDYVIQDLFTRGTRGASGVFLPGFQLKNKKSSARSTNCSGAFSCSSTDSNATISSVEYSQDFLISRLDREGLRDLDSQTFKFSYAADDIQQSMDDIIGNSQEARKVALAIASVLPSCDDMGKMKAGTFVRDFNANETKVSVAAPAAALPSAKASLPSMPSMPSLESDRKYENLRKVVAYDYITRVNLCYLAGPDGQKLSTVLPDRLCATQKIVSYDYVEKNYRCYLAGPGGDILKNSVLPDIQCGTHRVIQYDYVAKTNRCYLAAKGGEIFKRSVYKDTECGTQKIIQYDYAARTNRCYLAGSGGEVFKNSVFPDIACGTKRIIQYDYAARTNRCYLAGKGGEVFINSIYKDSDCATKKVMQYDYSLRANRCYLAGPGGEVFIKSIVPDLECASLRE